MSADGPGSPGRHDQPTDVLHEYPEDFEHGRLVGVNQTGVPIYYEPTDQRAYEVVRSGGELEPREPRWTGPVSSIVEDVEEAIGWGALSEFARDRLEAD